MTPQEIERALERAERSHSLTGTGFWKAVDACRRDRALADRFADRVAKVDREAFVRLVTPRVPLAAGLTLLAGATASGAAAIWAARHPSLSVQAAGALVFLIGFGALLIGSHSLTHYVVGRSVGIRFTHVFLGGPPPPRPGVKTDYASYLRASPRARAVMHASGAIVTKIVPFALVPFSIRPWITWILVGIGVVQIVTDVTLSTKVSDWKKARREWSAAQRT